MRTHRIEAQYGLVLWLGLVTAACFAGAGSVACGEDAIDVGSRKQLFIDEKFIESSQNVTLTMNPPYQTGEVLITADQPHEEGGHVSLYSSVLKDDDGRVRIWYDLVTAFGSDPHDHHRRVCYAESADGLRFVKPELGFHEVDGSMANNVVLPGRIGGCAVWIDPNAPPEHRYKTQTKFYPTPGSAAGEFLMHSSPDGLQWSLFAKINPRGNLDTQTVVFWDQYLERYLFYGRHKPPTPEADIQCRKVRRAEMTDLTEIENTGLAIWPDAMDRGKYETPEDETPVDYYGATVFPYEEADRVYIMLAQAFWHWMPNGAPGTRDVRLAVSRDSKVFERVGNRAPFLRMGPAGRFDSRGVWAMPNPIVMGDEIWIYYVGTSRDRSGQIDAEAAVRSAISRAVMRLDGFVSADAPYEGGELTTPALRFDGKRLELNLDTSAGGGVRVELLDATGTPIPGFSGDAAPWLVGNSVRMPVTWNGTSDLSDLVGQTIRIRFEMRDCKLYAFQFVQ